MPWKQMCPGLLLVHRSTVILVLSLPSAVAVTPRPEVAATTRLHSLLIFRRTILSLMVLRLMRMFRQGSRQVVLARFL